MTFLNHEEDPPNPPQKCTFLTSTIKEAFANCRNCHRRVPKTEEKEDSLGEMDDEQEVVVVSEIRSRATEAKSRRKACLNTEGLNFVFSPEVGELFGTQKPVQMNEESELERDEFFSVGSSLSRCSSTRSTEAFLSVKTNFSRCSSLSGLERGDFRQFDVHSEFWHGLDFQDLRRRSIIQEVCHCEGWPFGLCRKALLLPPLPKSPSESWSWRKKC
ncbi:hypothetical protein RHSIM_Rhsim06G0048100 [Rhododendron simsii]|uniref:Uncharacterized protein n=1 Tax=Rhododendron simsii TaxID=118357 RepID=A0A834GXK9_RHOSS|nr:hypothetical protein RHSIM_Rhsim06G0048100 [Rhododendron simsii]